MPTITQAATPSEGEPGKTVDGAFADSRLEALLDDIGATTLVLCGSSPLTEATARQAVALGYQVFVPAGAVGAPGKDPADAGALEGANMVDTLTTLNAAADAKARQRWQAERSRRP
jgi:nicotinamidase-related amidase